MNRLQKPLEIDIKLSNKAARWLLFAGVIVIARKLTKNTDFNYKYTKPEN